MIVRYWVRPEGHSTTVPAIKCADGFTMSVQASRTHYCTPRNDVGPYTAVEVGFPSKHENRLAPYGDNNSDVFAWVPVDVLDEIIRAHGGLKEQCK